MKPHDLNLATRVTIGILAIVDEGMKVFAKINVRYLPSP
jgi:hypothetical protein